MLFRKTIFFLLLLPSFIFGQSIANGSFEFPESSLLPDDLSQINEADGWEDALAIPSSTGPHTSDWLSTCFSNHIKVFEEDPLNPDVFTQITANTGCRYGGMLAAELFQQDIGDYEDNEHLSIKMSLYIRLPYKWYFSNSSDIEREPLFTEGMTLDFYSSKDKITYENQDDHCNESDGAGYIKNGDHLVKSYSVPISISRYPQGEWHLVEASFVAPSSKHDWLAFEFTTPIENNTDCKFDYILIDDVSIEVTDCSNCSNCSPYDGCIDYTVLNNPHGQGSPFSIGGLSNVDYFKLDIYETLGSPAIRTIAIGNSPQIVSWDGKDNAGNEVPSAYYYYELELINSCQRVGSSGENNKFFKSNSIGDTTTFIVSTMSYSSFIVQDLRDACCYDCLEINANSVAYLYPPTTINEVGATPVITGEHEDFIARKVIKVDPGVVFLPDAKVVLQAGEEIFLNHEGVNVLAGAEVTCVIDQCMRGFSGSSGGGRRPPVATTQGTGIKYQSKGKLIDSTSNSIIVQESELSELRNTQTNEFAIYPNPSKEGIYTITFSNSLNEDIVANINNVLGSLVYTSSIPRHQDTYTIDISDQPNGVYYVTINFAHQKFVRKIIKSN